MFLYKYIIYIIVSQHSDVFLLKFEFDSRHLPLHILESTYIGCLGGHDRILSEIGINVNSQIPPPPANQNTINNNNNEVIIEDDDLADIDFDEELLNLEYDNTNQPPPHTIQNRISNNSLQPSVQPPPPQPSSSTTVPSKINEYFSQKKKQNTSSTSFNYHYQDNNAYIPTPPDDFDETLSPIIDSTPTFQSSPFQSINIKNLCEDIKSLYETIPDNQNKNVYLNSFYYF